MPEKYEFYKMILSSPALIVFLTAAASLLAARIQIIRDREKQKMYLDFLELMKPTVEYNNADAIMIFSIEVSKFEIFAPHPVATCASDLLVHIVPKGKIFEEISEGKSWQDIMIKIEKEQKEHPETEEEKKQRIRNFSASLQVLQNAMRDDMREYTCSI